MPTKRKSIPVAELVQAIDLALVTSSDAGSVVAFLSGWFGRDEAIRAALERVLQADAARLTHATNR